MKKGGKSIHFQIDHLQREIALGDHLGEIGERSSYLWMDMNIRSQKEKFP